MKISKNKNTGLIALGEIMMRLNCLAGKRFTDPGSFDVLFGGAEANVCALLSGLGTSSRLISCLPENELGLAAIAQLRGLGVDTSGIIFGKGRMGLYFTENGHMLRSSKVIYDRKDSAFFNLERGKIDWATALQNAGWFHWSGITPALSANTAAVCMDAIGTANQMGIPVSADLNFRSSLWDYGTHPSSVIPEMISCSDLVVGDLHAASVYFGITNTSEASVEDQFKSCAEAMKARFGSLQAIAFSFRNSDDRHMENYRGAIYYENDYYFSPCHFLPMVIDRIGSGDAFTAGLIHSIWNGYNPQLMIDFATACGILKHSVYGDFARFSQKEVNQFMKQGPGNRVIR
jgi:2-dehydro-3-deoxygluconokinase